jgi:hypothetical protein
MAEKTTKPSAKQQTKIEKIEELYGKGKATATLEETSKFLTSKGFGALAEFLTPAK